MELDQLPSAEITQEMWDDETPAEQSEGAGDFTTADEQAPGDTASDEPAAAPAEAASDPKPEAAPAAAPAAADPFAGLPEPVRAALAAQRAEFDQRVRTAEGRVSALQRELAQRASAAPPAEAPKPKAIDAIREELPEVAAAIEEATGKTVDPAALRAEIMAELQEATLNDERPNWAQEVTSPEFKAWVAKQADGQAISSTGRASVLLKALKRFDADQAAAAQRQQTQQTRQRRVAAAVVPNGAARQAALTTDDMSEDEYWDHITKDG